jgi:hypothetical protein
VFLGLGQPRPDGVGEAGQPRAAERGRVLVRRHRDRRQPVGGLHQQRREQQLDAFQVGGVPEEVDPDAVAGPAHHAAPQRDGHRGEQSGLVQGVRRIEEHHPVADRITGRIGLGQQRLVHAVLGDQFGGLGGERLGLGRSARRIFSLGQQLADPSQERVGHAVPASGMPFWPSPARPRPRRPECRSVQAVMPLPPVR